MRAPRSASAEGSAEGSGGGLPFAVCTLTPAASVWTYSCHYAALRARCRRRGFGMGVPPAPPSPLPPQRRVSLGYLQGCVSPRNHAAPLRPPCCRVPCWVLSEPPQKSYSIFFSRVTLCCVLPAILTEITRLFFPFFIFFFLPSALHHSGHRQRSATKSDNFLSPSSVLGVSRESPSRTILHLQPPPSPPPVPPRPKQKNPTCHSFSSMHRPGN